MLTLFSFYLGYHRMRRDPSRNAESEHSSSIFASAVLAATLRHCSYFCPIYDCAKSIYHLCHLHAFCFFILLCPRSLSSLTWNAFWLDRSSLKMLLFKTASHFPFKAVSSFLPSFPPSPPLFLLLPLSF